MLKKVSIIHYLHSLTPVPVPEGPFALVAEPTPAWLAVSGLLVVCVIVLLLAGVRIRKLEIKIHLSTLAGLGRKSRAEAAKDVPNYSRSAIEYAALDSGGYQTHPSSYKKSRQIMHAVLKGTID
ncbi:MAG TPA: hypothetical protein VN345_11010 [Blastocatellia bacterium]|nr:hypothetical protein [Blastocatellia bacterium]